MVASGVAGDPVWMGHVGLPAALDTREPDTMGALVSVWGGRAWSMGREATMVAPLLVCHLAMVLHFYGGPSFHHKHFRLWISSLPPSWAVSSQPKAFFMLGLLSKPHVPTPSPCPQWWIHIAWDK